MAYLLTAQNKSVYVSRPDSSGGRLGLAMWLCLNPVEFKKLWAPMSCIKKVTHIC